MTRLRLTVAALAMIVALLAIGTASVGAAGKTTRFNVALKSDPTTSMLAQLGTYGKVRDVLYQIDAVTMQGPESVLPQIRALPFVAAANPDAERQGAPIDTVAATNFGNGMNTWDLDAVNVTNYGAGRTVAYDGTGVYVAVLDTGLLDSWRQYFPQERIATEYARSFGGGGNEEGGISEQPNKWEHDQNSHGTHVTSTILGYSLLGATINGVAPMAKVIPVKVLNQNGSGWSSVVAAGIMYVADLKSGPLRNYPVVINMSLGGPELDAVEKNAIDYAIARGVVVVASAGNAGDDGMGYPGAYQPVISVAASGWIGEWTASNWWRTLDVPDPTDIANYYITDFSSRQKAGQDLDVAAPGSWVVGPYQTQSGKISYFYLGGTSMASPHVAGIAALMADKNGTLTGPQVESVLTGSAIPLAPGCRSVIPVPGLPAANVCWGADASGSGLATADAALAATP